MATAALKRTPLYEAHVAAGAKLVPFAGFQMPVEYEGVRAEHLAVRSACGVFDVSHMGEIETSGPEAQALLQRLLSNDLEKLEVGGAQYSVLCREDGGILDDLFTYRPADDRYLTVTNAANHERDFAWFEEHAAGFDAEVADAIGDYAMLAVQGPEARAIVAELADGELPPRMHTAALGVAGAETLVCGTGYTGEDGVELLVAPDRAAEVWEALTALGARPAGLAARDTLRLEVCFHLYGNDMDDPSQPDRGGAGLVLQGGDGLHRRGIGRRSPRAGRGREAGAVRAHGSRHPPAGKRRSSPVGRRWAWSPAGRCRRRSRWGSGWPTSPPTSPSPEPRSRSTSAASCGPRA